jgi:hypothetical protein
LQVPCDGISLKGSQIAIAAARRLQIMKQSFGILLVLSGALVAGGCATKKYVQQTEAPIQSKVDQVADQANKEGTDIDANKKDMQMRR